MKNPTASAIAFSHHARAWGCRGGNDESVATLDFSLASRASVCTLHQQTCFALFFVEDSVMLIRRFASSARFAAGSSWCARLLIVGVLACGLALAERAHAKVLHPPVEWTYWPGNGHYYSVVSVPKGISWTDAESGAVALGGWLATVTSNEENDFIFTLIDDEKYWNDGNLHYRYGPWIGGFREPSGPWVWQWVTGESFDYANWAPGEPNNWGGQEYFIHYFSITAGTRSSMWNDQDDWMLPPVISYVVERSSNPCVPTADLNCDGVVDVSDLLILLSNWGPCPTGGTPAPPCIADINGDGTVDVSDLLMLLASWG